MCYDWSLNYVENHDAVVENSETNTHGIVALHTFIPRILIEFRSIAADIKHIQLRALQEPPLYNGVVFK